MERNGRRSSSGSSSPIGSKCTTYLGFIVLVIKLNSSWKSLPICSSAANEKTIELLEDISRDLINYDLEFRIQELESKFTADMSETTFNELKELKKKQNLN